MSGTIMVALILFCATVMEFSLTAAFLRLGLRWVKCVGFTVRRILIITLGIVCLRLLTAGLFLAFPSPTDRQAWMIMLSSLGAVVVIPCFIISLAFRCGIGRSFLVFLTTLLTHVVIFPLMAFVVKPFLCDSYFITSIAMAPTLVGEHRLSKCPECGEAAYSRMPRPAELVQMICKNFHVHPASESESPLHGTDKILVAKFLAPARWDLAVFQAPDKPSEVYVMRLIGLPGETIWIDDGAVWVNDHQLAPPESLRGITYLSEYPEHDVELWGHRDRPAVLGSDEYFVLGDFSYHARDSRTWKEGAPGHNPFAVPKSHLRGVVTNIYWPTERWRSFR